jgi:hypothetical protein
MDMHFVTLLQNTMNYYILSVMIQPLFFFWYSCKFD